ncbi:hypothetical protein ACS73_24795 [Pseudomonas lini]|nr:hypothetical protein ACS73_24795 [Pseudomonas lini]
MAIPAARANTGTAAISAVLEFMDNYPDLRTCGLGLVGAATPFGDKARETPNNGKRRIRVTLAEFNDYAGHANLQDAQTGENAKHTRRDGFRKGITFIAQHPIHN